AMVNYLMTLGWSPGDDEIVPWSQIEPVFRLEDVNKSPAFFDLKKLAAFNGEYIRMLPLDEFIARCDEWLPAEWDRSVFARMAEHVQTRVVTMADVAPMVDFLFHTEPEIDEGAWNKTMGTEFAVPLLRDVIDAYDAAGSTAFDAGALKGALEAIADRYEQKLGKAQAPVRVAITGRTVGPPLFESLEVMGREETLRRLRAALARAGG
ncbi:MAG: glutamate--tRNA ligase, partial [Ilumatobacteraceae bacterium]